MTLYESGRVSVLWELRTKSQYDTALWGILAPPNDVVKHKKFLMWLEKHHQLAETVRAGIVATP